LVLRDGLILAVRSGSAPPSRCTHRLPHPLSLPRANEQTTTAGSIAFGFAHQCRSLSPHCKVLATAFSNVGADNLAERFLKLGLKVVRVGKPSGVSESLWPHTLDAAIERDPKAQRALEDAARITAKAKRGASSDGDSRRTNRGSISAERAKRDAATDAVKASIQVISPSALFVS
jgi:hypothetical protein